jgi:hypothetical protein
MLPIDPTATSLPTHPLVFKVNDIQTNCYCIERLAGIYMQAGDFVKILAGDSLRNFATELMRRMMHLTTLLTIKSTQLLLQIKFMPEWKPRKS